MGDKTDVTLDENFDIGYGEDGDFLTTRGFDTALKMSILCEQRADAEEVSVPRLRRGWIGNLDQSSPNGSKVWLYDQTRRVQSTLNGIRDAAQNGLEWIRENHADTVEVDVTFTTQGVLIKPHVAVGNMPVESVSIELWKFTGD